MIITLKDNALIADIKKALKLIPGVASVRVATMFCGCFRNFYHRFVCIPAFLLYICRVKQYVREL